MGTRHVLAEIESERELQKLKFSVEADDQHGHTDWCAIVVRHLGHAMPNGTSPFDHRRYRRQLIRAAAVLVAAVESHDRCTGEDHSVVAPKSDPGY